MDVEEERKPGKPEIVIGEELGLLSVEELERRIGVLLSEIERFKMALAAKRQSREAANAVFRTLTGATMSARPTRGISRRYAQSPVRLLLASRGSRDNGRRTRRAAVAGNARPSGAGSAARACRRTRPIRWPCRIRHPVSSGCSRRASNGQRTVLIAFHSRTSPASRALRRNCASPIPAATISRRS